VCLALMRGGEGVRSVGWNGGVTHSRPLSTHHPSQQQGLPLGSGLGSSAASAAAAAVAVNALFGSPLTKGQLVHAGLAAEAAVSGFHADNVAPALMGGFVLVRSTEDPLDVRGLTYGGAAGCVSGDGGGGDGSTAPLPSAPAPLWFALVNPVFEAPTAAMRAALPPSVPFKDAVHNAGAGGALVAGILAGDPALVGWALGADALVEPVRGPLIPGFGAVKAAAVAAGAYGCTISGAGPTCVAVVPDERTGRAVCDAMAAAFESAGGLAVNSRTVAALDPVGARVV
jgi:homoserine kinase